jgi:hypothetical protein
MRLEIELDYEPEPSEEEAIVAAADDQLRLRQVVQGIFGFTGAVVQGVGVVER